MQTARTVIRRYRILNIALIVILLISFRFLGIFIPLAYAWKYAVITCAMIAVFALVSVIAFRIIVVGLLTRKLNGDLYYKVTSDRAMLLRSTKYHLDGALWSGDYAKAADIAGAFPKYTFRPNKKAHAVTCLAHIYFETANYDKLARACEAFDLLANCREKRRNKAYIEYYKRFLTGDYVGCADIASKIGKRKTDTARRLFLSGCAKMKDGSTADGRRDLDRLVRMTKNINISRLAAGMQDCFTIPNIPTEPQSGYDRVHKDETVKRTVAALIIAALLTAHLSYCINRIMQYQSILEEADNVQGHVLGWYYKGEDEEIVDFNVKWNGRFVFTAFLAESAEREINLYFVSIGSHGEHVFTPIFRDIKPGGTYKTDATADDGSRLKVTAVLFGENDAPDGTEAKAQTFRFHGETYTLCLYIEE